MEHEIDIHMDTVDEVNETIDNIMSVIESSNLPQDTVIVAAALVFLSTADKIPAIENAQSIEEKVMLLGNLLSDVLNSAQLNITPN